MLPSLQRRVVVAAVAVLALATPLHAQQPAPKPAARPAPDSLIFLIEDKIDALGTIALVTRDSGAPYLGEIVKSAITPQLVDAVIRVVEQHHREVKGVGGTKQPLRITRKTTLRPVPAADRARVNAVVARLHRNPRRIVQGIGMQVAVAIPIRSGS